MEWVLQAILCPLSQRGTLAHIDQHPQESRLF